MKITGEILVFKGQRGYSTSISNKKEDGNYENMSVFVNFRKGTELENKTKINVKDGFLSFYTNSKDEKIIKLVVLDFDIIETESKTEITEDDELPF